MAARDQDMVKINAKLLRELLAASQNVLEDNSWARGQEWWQSLLADCNSARAVLGMKPLDAKSIR